MRVYARVQWAAVFALAVMASGASALTYTESFRGDLSGDGQAPTLWELTHGNHTLTATSGGGDFDLLAITIPASHRLDSVVLNTYSGTAQSFTGVQASATWTAGMGANPKPSAMLGWTHFGPSAAGARVGENILDDLGMSKQGSAGFTPPLGPGIYTFLFQDTGSTVTYAMRFNVSFGTVAVPGDFNGDTVVDGIDLAQWKTDFGVGDGSDADDDFDTDGNDFLIWQQHLGAGAMVSAVPEPSAFLLGAVGLSAVMARWRR